MMSLFSRYKKIFCYLLEVCILNSYRARLFCTPGLRQTFLDFRINLVEQLLSITKDHTVKRRRPARHYHAYNPPTLKRVHGLRKCILCVQNGKNNVTVFRCPDCDVSLCILPCFEKYHIENGL